VYNEHGWHDPLSGIDASSIWLDEAVLRAILAKHGFRTLHEQRHNAPAGPRLNIVATRDASFHPTPSVLYV
jgi:hypothetical protein